MPAMLGPVIRSSCWLPSSVQSFGTKRGAAERRFDDGVAAVADDDRVAAIQHRANVAAVVCQVGECAERVEHGERAGVLGERPLVGRRLGDELGKERRFELPQAGLGAEELLLLLLQLDGHEALGAGEVCLRM